jgi:lipid A 4'-phosphatase
VKAAIAYFGALALTLGLFLLLPQIDLLTSGLFYSAGRGFLLKKWPPVEWLYHSVPWLAWGIVVAVGVGAAWLFLVERPLWRLDRKTLCFLALSTALGPGLIVNTILKDHWGRARPEQIEAFGGTRQFTPAPLPAAQCPTNCSFPSGHAALGFSLVAFAFLLPGGAPRRRATGAALGFGALIGLVRIVQGAHFLSDVVYAGLIVYGTTALMHWWIVERDGLAAPMLRRPYRAAGRAAVSAWLAARRTGASSTARWGLGTLAAAVLVATSIATFDQPLARFCHALSPDVHALFGLTGRLGLGYGWLTLFGVGFAALHWGGMTPRLRPFERRLRAWSPIPAFLFASVAASGIAADVLKVVFGRMRPKLLFRSDLYGFTWFAWHADHWSFPSGHTATIVSVMAAFWTLWPTHLLFYIMVGSIVAASRVVDGAHFLADTIGGAWLAILTTRGVALLFVRGGIDLGAARHGRSPPDRVLPWPCRRLARLPDGVATVRDSQVGR